jgi:5-methylcytosine-specific restriction endonuclease McrA
MGRTLREEVFHEPTQAWRGESHLMAWERIIRADPCSYCGAEAGTIDHVEPRSRPVRGLGGAHSWANVVAACESCNGRKATRSLLTFLRIRVVSAPRTTT